MNEKPNRVRKGRGQMPDGKVEESKAAWWFLIAPIQSVEIISSIGIKK